MSEFKFNKENLRQQIEAMRGEWSEGEYSPYESEDTISKQEYEKNINQFLLDLDRMTTPEYGSWAIENAPRKKDGTFHKGRITSRVPCGNTIFIQEWHNTWVYSALTVRATDDTTLELVLDHVTDTPG